MHGDSEDILKSLALQGNTNWQEQHIGTLHSSQQSVEDVVVFSEHRSQPHAEQQAMQEVHSNVAQQGDPERNTDGVRGSDALTEATTATRQLLQPEAAGKNLAIVQAAMASNLKHSKWLADFEPLSMSCPLLGRRVPAEAVSEWAADAWDCDGLGFSWACLQPGQA